MMQEQITNYALGSATGVKMSIVGGATAVICGVTVNQVEAQLIGVFTGAFIGFMGVGVQAWAKYMEHKVRVQVLLQSGEWDGKDRRGNSNGTDKIDT